MATNINPKNFELDPEEQEQELDSIEFDLKTPEHLSKKEARAKLDAKLLNMKLRKELDDWLSDEFYKGMKRHHNRGFTARGRHV